MLMKNIISRVKSWFVHRSISYFHDLSENKKKEVLRIEAEEFTKKYGSVINALANE
ncbi:hypothetical protein HY633_01970 [Candidatus Uhrbacteria bacterium]|nr:hypothetical protein [Candidatus Uhrbacteria bacterium]